MASDEFLKIMKDDKIKARTVTIIARISTIFKSESIVNDKDKRIDSTALKNFCNIILKEFAISNNIFRYAIKNIFTKENVYPFSYSVELIFYQIASDKLPLPLMLMNRPINFNLDIPL